MGHADGVCMLAGAVAMGQGSSCRVSAGGVGPPPQQADWCGAITKQARKVVVVSLIVGEQRPRPGCALE